MQFVSKFVKKSKSKSSKGHQFTREKFENLKGSNYACTWRMWASCSTQQGRPPDLRISRQSNILFWCGIVRRPGNHRDALERRRGPKSLHSTSLHSRFRVWASCSAEQARPHDLRISRQSHGHFGRRLVRRDHRDALERLQGPNSLRRASLRCRFPMWSSCPVQQAWVAWPHDSRISRQSLTLFGRGLMRWERAGCP